MQIGGFQFGELLCSQNCTRQPANQSLYCALHTQLFLFFLPMPMEKRRAFFPSSSLPHLTFPFSNFFPGKSNLILGVISSELFDSRAGLNPKDEIGILKRGNSRFSHAGEIRRFLKFSKETHTQYKKGPRHGKTI